MIVALKKLNAQTSDESQSVEVSLPGMEPGDKIKAVATCNLKGERTDLLTIPRAAAGRSVQGGKRVLVSD